MSGKNRTGAKSLPRLLYCPDQMLPVMMLSGFRPKTSEFVSMWRLMLSRGLFCGAILAIQ